MELRIGQGIDIHSFSKDRKLILGGITIPSDFGLMGHSDADALLHSITDALLGALSLGDIGKYFPDTDPNNKDLDSKIFLLRAYELILEKGYKIQNIDNTILLEKPKLRDHIDTIRENISKILSLNLDQVSIKATTSEKMGFVGKREGIEVHSIVLLSK
ncbi:UNVERIFIED_CONTAM: hypothetical protein GTU68_033124 [Idotea baltica]|nr:hypothetical protein [Idotea baltica]